MTVKNDINFSTVSKKIKASSALLAQSSSLQLERYAKQNRSWIDRTSNARNSIKGTWGWKGSVLEIGVSGNTDYFKYLELAHEKRYSILRPTVISQATPIFSAFARIFK